MFNKIELDAETLLGKSFKEQFSVLRRFLSKKYKVDYISTFMMDSSDVYKVLEGDPQITEEFANGLKIDMPQIKFNKDILQDSKDRGIRARFSIPIKLNNAKFLMLLEAKKYSVLRDKEKEIFKDIYTFKNMINNA